MVRSSLPQSLFTCIIAVAAACSAWPSPAWCATASVQEFAPGIISTGHEFSLTFTPDGNTACFSRFAKGNPTHIFCSSRVHGQWQPPAAIAFSSADGSDLDPAFTPDGKKLFFISTRPHETAPAAGNPKNMDIWVVERHGNTWGTPRVVENVNSAAKEGSPSVARDGTLYFFSDRDGDGRNALYTSTLSDGHYTAPRRLPAPVNSGGGDTSPFITPDGKTLLFYSMRDGGKGKADIYVSRLDHGAWTTPVNIGPPVNTAEFEYNPSISPDGQRLYFGRNRRIFELRIDQLPTLKGIQFR